ncbi:MAG: hypothetical protein R2734_13465 [Nocardioides sp.]
MLSSRGKRLGDYAAGTYVVRERVRLAPPPPPSMPHALAGRAATADIASLPTGLTLAVRQFLAGVHRVEPCSLRHQRWRVVSLAQQASAYVARCRRLAPIRRRSWQLSWWRAGSTTRLDWRARPSCGTGCSRGDDCPEESRPRPSRRCRATDSIAMMAEDH